MTTQLETAAPAVDADPTGHVHGEAQSLSPTAQLTLSGIRPELQERMHHYFEASCDRTPWARALEWEGGALTYAELDRRANAMAHHLIALGARRGGRIGLLLPRCTELYVALLGIMKAGSAFVPIDPSSPADRVAFVAGDSELDLVVSCVELEDSLREITVPTVLADSQDTRVALARRPGDRPAPEEPGDDPTAYVIYTSGSSGRPKGVDVAQHSICNFIHVISEVYDVRAEDRVYQGMTIAFDFAIEEVWPTWAMGATLVVGPTDSRRVGPGLTEFLEQHRITLLYCVPTVLSTVTRTIDSIRAVMVGGEACPAELVERWAPGRRMLNTYGPTEATVTCVWSVLLPNRPVTIGIPVPSYTAYILDEQRRPVPAGEVGELCIGGPGVARGYLGRPDLTEDRFIQHPHDPGQGRIYRTGDLARVQADGEIVYLGRADAEVKVRGHRVDLGEIESVMMRDPRVPTAAVTQLPGDSGGDLAAYVTTATAVAPEDERAFVRELWNDMRTTLPGYMIPSFVEVVDEIPMLPSGKVDRNRLPAPISTRLIGGSGDHVAAEGEIEEWMVGVWAQALEVTPDQVSVTADFFDDLGGHSLFAATLVSALRSDPRGASLSVMDLYAAPTVRQLAARAEELGAGVVPEAGAVDRPAPASMVRIWGFGVAQIVAILGTVTVGLSPIALAYWWFAGVPTAQTLQLLVFLFPLSYLLERWVGPLIVARLFGHRLAPGEYPLYGWTHLRVWLVGKAMSFSPLTTLAGSAYAAPYLRWAGADVHDEAHLGTAHVNLPSLLHLGPGATVGYGTHLEGWSIADGRLRIGEVRLHKDATVAANCVLTGPCSVGEETILQEQSSLAPGTHLGARELWRGAPARPLERLEDPIFALMARCRQAPTTWAPAQRANFLVGILALELLPLAALLPVVALVWWVLLASGVGWALAVTTFTGPVFVVTCCALILLMRSFGLPRTPVGVHHLRSQLGVEKWFADKLLDSSLSLTNSLYSTLYTPHWLRLLGARVGARAEVSTISNIDPDLLTLGAESFVADMASVGSATYCHHHVAFRPTRVEERAFVGNASYLPSGARLGRDSLLGVASTPQTGQVPDGTSWLGSPAFFLPRREIYEGFGEEQTFAPPRSAVVARYVMEFFRIVVPASLLAISTFATLQGASWMARAGLSWWVMLLGLPVIALTCALGVVLLVALLKWVLMGRYRPRVEPLWSSFVRRSELVTGIYEAAAVPVLLDPLRGTPWLGPLLRLFGVRVGRRALVETTYVTEFDLVRIGPGSHVGPAVSLQTHLFEDRVMKMDHVTVRQHVSLGTRSVVLYGSDVADDVHLEPLSLVMKGESIPAATRWAGIPAQPAHEAGLAHEEVAV